ncbi:MAG: ABC transporter permease, partial [Dehalococcoidia bacterium]
FVRFPPSDFTLTWYADYFNGDDPLVHWVGSTITSVETATLVALFSVLLGGLVSYSLVRGRFPGKPIINSLAIAPLIIPTVVTVVIIFRLYFFHMNFLMGNVPGLAIPHTILALPYVVIILTATLRNVDEVQEHAAMSLGANRLTTLRRIIVPQMIPGLAIAAFLAFLVSFNEVVIALLLKTRTFQTLPMNIWNGRVGEFAPMMAAVSTLMLLAAVTFLVGALYFRRRSVRHAR